MGKQILSSFYYEMFEHDAFNRNIGDLKPLFKSMKENGFMDEFPIVCVRNKRTGKLKIKSGHHRFEAAQMANVPVKYIVADDDFDVAHFEITTKPWSLEDYVASRCRMGDEVYVAIDKYVRETGIPIGCAISILGGESAGSGNKHESCKRGTFKIAEFSQAEKIKDIVLHMKRCGIPFANRRPFINALSKCLWVNEFNTRVFKKKIKTYAQLMVQQTSEDKYLDEIQRIYNYKTQIEDKVEIAFEAKKIGQRRKKSFGK